MISQTPSRRHPTPTGRRGIGRPIQTASASSLSGAGRATTASPHYFSILDVAGLFGVGERTVRRWIRQQRIPFIHIGGVYRFHNADLLQFVIQHRIEARGHNTITPKTWDMVRRLIALEVQSQMKGEAA